MPENLHFNPSPEQRSPNSEDRSPGGDSGTSSIDTFETSFKKPMKMKAPVAFMSFELLESSESLDSPRPEPGEITPLGRGLPGPTRSIPHYNPDQVTFLGKGAFGNTFRVNPDKGSPFVVKEIDTAKATVRALDIPSVSQKDIEKHVQKMHVELKAMERVRGHENIVHLLGSDEDEQDQKFRIAMSLAPGQALKKSSLTEQQSKLAIQQLVNALNYCHSQDVAHLDVKPENILWDKKTRHLTLVDFGEARFMDDKGEIERHMSAGTAAYRPMMNDNSNGIRVDAYAVGKTLRALLSESPSPTAEHFIKQCENGILDSEDPWLKSLPTSD